MIVAYSRQDYPSEVLSLYRQMVGDGVRPDSSTFTASLRRAQARWTWKMVEKFGIRRLIAGTNVMCLLDHPF
ncbi:hypothetical protein ACFX2J_003836 [Malus domestica]